MDEKWQDPTQSPHPTCAQGWARARRAQPSPTFGCLQTPMDSPAVKWQRTLWMASKVKVTLRVDGSTAEEFLHHHHCRRTNGHHSPACDHSWSIICILLTSFQCNGSNQMRLQMSTRLARSTYLVSTNVPLLCTWTQRSADGVYERQLSMANALWTYVN